MSSCEPLKGELRNIVTVLPRVWGAKSPTRCIGGYHESGLSSDNENLALTRKPPTIPSGQKIRVFTLIPTINRGGGVAVVVERNSLHRSTIINKKYIIINVDSMDIVPIIGNQSIYNLRK